MRKWLYIVLICVPCFVYAEHNDLHAEADRPGMGTGTNVLDRGYIQWETGFEVAHQLGTHLITLPTTLFRFGLCPWAELRLEYTGALNIVDQPNATIAANEERYAIEPLYLGTKLRLWQGSEEASLRWIPRTSLLLNIGLPLSSSAAKEHPITGKVDLLFENDIVDWLTIGYDLGAYWTDWKPAPDVFASLSLNFTPTDKLGLFIESYNNFGFQTTAPRSSTIYDINLDFGISYMVHPRVQLDASSGFNLYNSEASLSLPRNNVFVGIGVTWLIHPY